MLIIDEAQNMDIETLEELRMLTNVNTDKDQILQLLLVGQPELADKLRRPELRQFRQRISAGFHLTPLNFRDTCSRITSYNVCYTKLLRVLTSGKLKCHDVTFVVKEYK